MSALEHPNIFKSFAALAAKHPDKTAVVFLGTGYAYGRLLLRSWPPACLRWDWAKVTRL